MAACATSRRSFEEYQKNFCERVRADGEFVAVFQGRAACRRLVQQIERQLGPIGLLVNNAVANPTPTTLREMTESYCRMMIEVNFLAPLWLAQAAEASLVAQRGGIINISSIRVQKFMPANHLYATTKAALEKLTESLAVELGPKGVRVNCIRVGAVPGAAFMRDTLRKLPAAKARRMVRDIMARHVVAVSHLSTTGRAGWPSDIAGAVAFLASPRAEFINGAILPIDGGYVHQHVNWPKPNEKYDPRKAVEEWLAKHGD